MYVKVLNNCHSSLPEESPFLTMDTQIEINKLPLARLSASGFKGIKSSKWVYLFLSCMLKVDIMIVVGDIDVVVVVIARYFLSESSWKSKDH